MYHGATSESAQHQISIQKYETASFTVFPSSLFQPPTNTDKNTIIQITYKYKHHYKQIRQLLGPENREINKL